MRGRPRDAVAIAALFWLVVAVAAIVSFASAHASRLYPYVEVSSRAEEGVRLKQWATVGVPVSMGRFAPSIRTGVSTHGDLVFEVAVRYRLRGD